MFAYAFENLGSKTKKSIMRVRKGAACRARSIESGSLGTGPGVGSDTVVVGTGTMRCGTKHRRDQ